VFTLQPSPRLSTAYDMRRRDGSMPNRILHRLPPIILSPSRTKGESKKGCVIFYHRPSCIEKRLVFESIIARIQSLASSTTFSVKATTPERRGDLRSQCGRSSGGVHTYPFSVLRSTYAHRHFLLYDWFSHSLLQEVAELMA